MSQRRYAARSNQDLIDLLQSNPLAWLVSGEGESFRARLLPLRPYDIQDGRLTRLAGHFPLGDDQIDHLKANPSAQVLLLGPHDYISASWLSDNSWSPTWNFASACCHVSIEFVEDQQKLRHIMDDLVTAMESGHEHAWQINHMGARYNSLAQHIVGFIAHIDDVEERYKLGQEEDDIAYQEIVRALRKEGRDDLVDWMDRFNPQRGG